MRGTQEPFEMKIAVHFSMKTRDRSTYSYEISKISIFTENYHNSLFCIEGISKLC